MSNETINLWRIESSRLTVFGPFSIGSNTNNWFEDVMSVTPERTEIRRAEGIQVDTAIVDNKRVILQIQSGRVDWQITPHDSIGAIEGDIGGSADFESIFKIFNVWIHSLTTVNRLAVGAIFKARASDKIDSYKLLQGKLPSIKLDSNSSEFSYHINRPRTVTIADNSQLLINRISKWNDVIYQQISQQVTQEGFGISETVQLGHWARCEVDINTVVRDTGFLPEIREELLTQLIKIASEIVSDGDK